MSTALMFLREVFQSWLAIAGAILTILPFFQNWIEKALKRQLPMRILWGIGGACLLVSFYSAWFEQYEQAMRVIDENNSLSRQKAAVEAVVREKDKRIEELRDLLASRSVQGQSLPAQPMLSEAGKIILAQELWGGRGNTITIVNIGSNSLQITAQLREVFQRAGWIVMGSTTGRRLSTTVGASGAGAIRLEGLYLIARDSSSPSVRLIVSSFEQAGRAISVNGSTILAPEGDLALYAIYGNN